MSFFYNLNKTLDSIAARPESAPLNERDMGKHNNATTGFKAVADKAAKEYRSKAAGERVAGAQFQKMKKAGQLEEEGMGMTDEGNAFLDQLRKTPKGGKFKIGGKEYTDTSNLEEVGMTPKQKSFAALAPPADKITFADKIAGAKKEVDEMLGDVAAEAMRSALGGGKGRNAEMDEASDDNAFTAHKRARAETPKVGTITHGSKHDVEEIPGGRRVTRRTDAQGISVGADDGQSSSDAPRGRGRPKGPARAPERVTGGATRHKGGRKVKEGADQGQTQQIYDELADARAVAKQAQRGGEFPQGFASRLESVLYAAMTLIKNQQAGGAQVSEEELDDVEITDRGEYDQEGDMAKDSIKTVVRHAQALEKILGDNDNLPEWVQSKLAKIESMMTAVDDYMQNQETDQDDEMAMGEEKTSTRDSRAERAGKKVTKDIEYDEKKKDGIHGSRRGSEDNKADKAGKKVTKDIEHDEKEDDEREDKPKKSKSKFKFGGSVYENLDAQLETLINESMNISVNMATTDDGQQDSNSITVTASGEDAMTLAQLLKSAGLSQSSHSGCSVCGQSSCGCEQVDENRPDWPTNTETSDDALQYSGGLNKPKSTGQTTTPVLASQLRRQVSMEESVKIERNLFDLYKNFTK